MKPHRNRKPARRLAQLVLRTLALILPPHGWVELPQCCAGA
jgi:hypothetical protein